MERKQQLVTISFILFAVILLSIWIFFMMRSAIEMKKKSNKTVEEFKKVDKGLNNSTHNIDSANKRLLNVLVIKTVNMQDTGKKILDPIVPTPGK